MEKRNVILTGFMGTGKSTVGRRLSSRLDYAFVDTDEMIVSRDGRAIADIFSEDGEAAFRAWEAKVSRELAGSSGLVIATGGGLMLNEHNAHLLSQEADVFCLRASSDEIVARLAGEPDRRPLLNVLNPAGRIQQLLDSRSEAYGRFTQISTSGRSVDQIVEEIVRCISVT